MRIIWRSSLQVRDQLLGTDRGGRSYWLLTLDPARLWVQAAPPVPPPRDVALMGVRELKAEITSLGGQTVGLLEKSELAAALRAAREARAAAAAAGGGGGAADGDAAGHQCGWAWLCYDTYEQAARLAGSLDARGGGREAGLKARLLEVLPLLEQSMEAGSYV